MKRTQNGFVQIEFMHVVSLTCLLHIILEEIVYQKSTHYVFEPVHTTTGVQPHFAFFARHVDRLTEIDIKSSKGIEVALKWRDSRSGTWCCAPGRYTILHLYPAISYAQRDIRGDFVRLVKTYVNGRWSVKTVKSLP